jgi:hypothetical protein
MRRRPLVPATALLALLAAGCGGGGGPPGVANVASSTPRAQTGAVAFVRCMRSHGIPNWPDPESGGVFDKAKLQQLGVSGTRIRALEEGPCNHLLASAGGPPSGRQTRIRLADLLSFAHCMRNRGVRRFPDPTAAAGLTVAMVQAQGIDVHSSVVLHVVQTCLPASHGGLTAAKVEEAIRNASGGAQP